MRGSRVIIIGAGPKAMAIAAKQTALAELGFPVPELHIIERSEVGAHWTGRGGFTNGELTLGTSPEKDIGFPYRSQVWGDSLSRKIDRRMKDFSWASFLIDQGEYSDWIDRGRPAPIHSKWAQYLQWLSPQVTRRTRFYCGEAMRIELDRDQWKITVQHADSSLEICEGDGLVMTGPGRVRTPEPLPNDDRLLTIESFWSRYRQILSRGIKKVAIVGSGESAAAIALALQNTAEITLYSPRGMAYSRGESFFENRVYSHAERENWVDLSLEARREFIARTDRGVFSQSAQNDLSRVENFHILPGRYCAIESGGEEIRLVSEYQNRRTVHGFDLVVLAPGADPLGFLKERMPPVTFEELKTRAGVNSFEEEEIELKIESTLAISGLRPLLHIPMLAGVTQGPGFANLSCLGSLSDHILLAYVPL